LRENGDEIRLPIGRLVVARAWRGHFRLYSSAGARRLFARSGRVIALSEAGKYSEAISLAQAMVAELETSQPNSRDYAGALNNLAQLYGEVGRDTEAEPIYKRAIAVMEKAGGLDSAGAAPELTNLAAFYQRQGRYDEAEPLFKRALALWELARGPGHPDVGKALNNLATLYEREDRHTDAEPLFRRALAIYQKAAGPENPAVATILNNVGQVVKSEGRYAEAEPPIRQSLAIREKLLGRDHPDVARSLNNLADLYEREGRAADAEPLYLRALAIREHALGPDHPDVASSQNNLAAFYQAQNRTADALPLVEKTLASGRPQLRTALAVLFAAPGKQLMPQDKALDQALAVIQRGNQSSAASAVNKLAVRLAAGSDRLAELVRRSRLRRTRWTRRSWRRFPSPAPIMRRAESANGWRPLPRSARACSNRSRTSFRITPRCRIRCRLT
jgi:tetratricopeptide (TPR) repeat protein